jgi:hypothetical protein
MSWKANRLGANVQPAFARRDGLRRGERSIPRLRDSIQRGRLAAPWGDVNYVAGKLSGHFNFESRRCGIQSHLGVVNAPTRAGLEPIS